jgi:hypothetical protein
MSYHCNNEKHNDLFSCTAYCAQKAALLKLKRCFSRRLPNGVAVSATTWVRQISGWVLNNPGGGKLIPSSLLDFG